MSAVWSLSGDKRTQGKSSPKRRGWHGRNLRRFPSSGRSQGTRFSALTHRVQAAAPATPAIWPELASDRAQEGLEYLWPEMIVFHLHSRVTSSPRRSLWAWRGGSDRSAVAVATCAVCPRETFPRCCKLLQQPFRPHHHGTAAQRRCYIPQCHANALRQTLPDFSRVPKTTVPSPNSSPSTRTPTNMQICRLTA